MRKTLIKAKYFIETAHPLEQAAGILAGEQSCGTFLKVEGESEELQQKFSAAVDNIIEIGQTQNPSLPGAGKLKNQNNALYKQAIINISWPLENIGINLSNLVTTIAGNLFELKPFSGIRLLDFEVGHEFKLKYPGPKFGIHGTRKLTNVYKRPIIGTIIKPSIGLSPEQTAQRVEKLINAGIDFIKDDELQANAVHCPFEKRVKLVMEKINNFADKTGKKPMVAFNITADMDDMLRNHDFVLKQGGTCIMVSLNSTGISGIKKINSHTELPIHGHRNGWGAISRCNFLGFDFKAYQKIWRLAGVDHIHTNGLRNKFTEDDEAVIKSIKACLEPFLDGYEIMPVLSSAQWAGQAIDTYKSIGSTDLMYLCGGGINGHPKGAGAGVKSILQAWHAAISQISLAEYAQTHLELKQALDFFGKSD